VAPAPLQLMDGTLVMSDGTYDVVDVLIDDIGGGGAHAMAERVGGAYPALELDIQIPPADVTRVFGTMHICCTAKASRTKLAHEPRRPPT
jgi:hypothetical protein